MCIRDNFCRETNAHPTTFKDCNLFVGKKLVARIHTRVERHRTRHRGARSRPKILTPPGRIIGCHVDLHSVTMTRDTGPQPRLGKSRDGSRGRARYRGLPVRFGKPLAPIVQRPRTPAFHAGNTGSNPVGGASFLAGANAPSRNLPFHPCFAPGKRSPNGEGSAAPFAGGTADWHLAALC